MYGRLISFVVVLLATTVHAERKAMVVSNSTGRSDQVRLRFVERDAASVKLVLSDLGDFGATQTLQDKTGDEVLAGLSALAHGPRFDLFVFYYSGHGDAGGLWLGETYLPNAELLAAVRQVPADLRLVVLDSCQSGAAAIRKGVSFAPAVEVQIDQISSQGDVLITSSSAEEASFESQSLQGAVFTLQLVSGLRGAADEDRDGSVTLSEAYRYASVHTLHETLLSAAGPQRPTFRWDYTGRAEPILTHAGRAARLTLQSSISASYFVFDEKEDRLFAELALSKGQSARVLLLPGSYVVRSRDERETRTARVELAANDDRVLEDSKMATAPLVHLARKGGLGQWAASVAAGGGGTTLNAMSLFDVRAAVELARSWQLWSLEARFITGGVDRNGLTATQTAGGVGVAFLPGVSVGPTTLRAGLTAGVLVLGQQVTARPAAWGALIDAGVRVRLEVDLSSSISLILGGDGMVLVGRLDGRWAPAWLATGWLGLRFSL